jgi:hypothetical protein
VTPDEAITAMWEIENDCEDGDGVTFDAGSDQWWVVIAECAHGKVRASSRGPVDISSAFTTALSSFKRLHGKEDQ